MRTAPVPRARTGNGPSAGPPAAPPDLPSLAALAALRAWHEGLTARAAVTRYLPDRQANGQSSRGILGRIRRQLVACATARQRDDLISLFTHPAADRIRHAAQVVVALDALRATPIPVPQPADPVNRWLPPRIARALAAARINSLAALLVHRAHRKRWWQKIAGLGRQGAQSIEAFLAAHPELLQRAATLIPHEASDSRLVPLWSLVSLPAALDGSQGRFRAPHDTCGLAATNDYQAIEAWLALHESAHTVRAYRREAERLLLWAIVERRAPLSSLTTDDAIAYRAFLRHPTPAARWTGPPRPRATPAWRPFAGHLTARSAAYALAVLRALFGWLVSQHYVVLNPFAGVTVRGGATRAPFDTGRALTGREWKIVRAAADPLERTGWTAPAAERLRFVLDFGYATGLRAQELVAATLGDITADARGMLWLEVTGKGAKPGRVALPPLARDALRRTLKARGLPVRRTRWQPAMPLVAALSGEHRSTNRAGTGISAPRLRQVLGEFFREAAQRVAARHPALAEKLRRASPHWLRHTHATHALDAGVELVVVRDNLRHASVATTSTYLHGEEAKRARQVGAAFRHPPCRSHRQNHPRPAR
ncbi:TPA: tyrosine-type recombinase/integrase [Burkholderia aenigmatica]|uniref:phage integrase family protein n=1 Tax=Burkholderia sp. AU45251 TaxID=3059204 RepID=UPI0026511E69|nr:phage integrase family protein [Burkholderia sp. AU45251]HDR9486428.1 tyrosine-type recombinase/integrase [Burkholderia aenigmatica]MDN7519913.1 phage integrase family protein [Burkholderia sp. AU45251]HDR9517073.1 tyrosine-type recombinase/integrase [Burkholderia aenigmatica]HDR9594848.1 tyrosine-type recombinase/integrase [Burkholderia aenigmatica]HDR9600167.1 tyrosine-type recombinase/integrase [Burkholderia aenigmatica]